MYVEKNKICCEMVCGGVEEVSYGVIASLLLSLFQHSALFSTVSVFFKIDFCNFNHKPLNSSLGGFSLIVR